MLQLTFNRGLTLTGFRTTRPCSLNLLFGDVPVAVAEVVILNSLIIQTAVINMTKQRMLEEKNWITLIWASL